jgi:hypothetical protein
MKPFFWVVRERWFTALKFLSLVGLGAPLALSARVSPEHVAAYGTGPFDSFEDVWPTPTDYRTASGAPGPRYWQQEADYSIEITLDDAAQQLHGSEEIRYTNHSPHTLAYLWVQLDQNAFHPESASHRATAFHTFDENEVPETEPQSLSYREWRALKFREEFPGGYAIHAVEDAAGTALRHSIVETAMRVDLPQPLKPGETATLRVRWSNFITTDAHANRTGVERLAADDAPVYQVAQWYPRMCAYSETSGWQLAPYVDGGEFALEFGDFEVAITVPEHFVVAATGELQNAAEVLSPVQQEHLAEAHTADVPVFVVTLEEAAAARAESASGATKTWKFAAENVRDFAFATSPAYLWDAKGVTIKGHVKLAMSAYPAEAAPLWKPYSTEVVAATLEGYSRYVLPYPYPVAWSCWGPVYGMEYPMVSFQNPVAEDDGTYSIEARTDLIGVVIHEVGHNWFPMIINTDERKWMWLDEGVNSFIEDLVAMDFDPKVRRDYQGGAARTMKRMSEEGEEITMRQADFLRQSGFASYGKPSLGLKLLRESILGADTFDAAMREYARRWAFKRPIPADFFRTFEDVSGQDLDWFWRGWFYGDQAVDRAIREVTTYRMDPSDLAARRRLDRADDDARHQAPYDRELANRQTRADLRPELQDFYYNFDPYTPTEKEREEAADALDELKPWEKDLLDDNALLHLITIDNLGGLIMPLRLRLTFADGGVREHQFPVHLWAESQETVRIPIIDTRELTLVELDPGNPFRDTHFRDNRYPQVIETRRFFLEGQEPESNAMREAREGTEADETDAAESAPAAE